MASNSSSSTSTALPRRVALVTGGTRGIGLGIAQALAESGEYGGMLLTYNSNRQAAENVQQQLQDQCQLHVQIVGGDVAQAETRDAIFAEYDRTFDRGEFDLCTVVHNAGQYVGLTADNHQNLDATKGKFGDGSLLKDGEDRPNLDHMHYYQALYGDAYVDLLERSLVRMKASYEKSGDGSAYRGCLIGISSPGCNAIYQPKPGYDMPGSGKCVMEYAMRLYANNVAKYNINCNVIVPGPTRSDAWSKLAEQRGLDRDTMMSDFALKSVPAQRVVEARDVGDVVAFLAGSSGGGRFVTGLSIPVDGGMHLRY